MYHVEIALRFAQDNLDVKKVLAPSKNPAKWLIMFFSRIKNIKSLTSKNSGTLIVKSFTLKSLARSIIFNKKVACTPRAQNLPLDFNL
jgi:hypothetical protein